MRLSELIGRLDALRREHGDLPVHVGADGDNVIGFTAASLSVYDDGGRPAVLIDLTDSSCDVLSGPLATG
jgi:hypothetical protein